MCSRRQNGLARNAMAKKNMAKKKKTASKKSAAAGARTTAAKSGSKSPSARGSSRKKTARKRPKSKTSRHTDAWAALTSEELERRFREMPPSEILDAFERSYTSEVVNVLLDLRRASVRQLFEALAGVRKRAIATIVTLYHYRVYLMNPLPLEVGNERTPNYYAILGVPRDADAEDIRLAHRLLVKAHDIADFSPPMRAGGEERLAEIEDAYRHLHPETRRSQADQLLPNIHYLYPRRDHSWLEATLRILE